MNRRFTAAGLAIAGLAFAAYPALRPYGPESGAEGAADFGSAAWLIAHVLGMVGFVTLAFVLRSASSEEGLALWRWNGQPIRKAETRMWVAVVLLLPYYGAEAYGLNALGGYAVRTGDTGVLDIAERFRYAPFEMATFGLGLLLLAFVGARLILGLWPAGGLERLAGLLAGSALLTYLPQFFAPAGLRIAHGAVLGAGLVLLGVATARGARGTANPDVIAAS
ncbi:hypothetical protein [Nocardioides sp. GXZ039]|uniref:hypothetical protein n=1 Tax=Nocardioides sp. GXZ039 TaxID=3136018 RepID=UPI0030F42D71